MSEVNSAWNLEIDLQKGQVRRKRNFSTADGVKALPLEKKLRDLCMGLAGVAEMLGDEFSSTVVESKAEELAYGWARVAQENEKVRLVLRWLVETNAWTDAVIPTVLVGGSIAWHYDVLPDSIGQPIAKFAGAIPMTPEEEKEIQDKMSQMMAAEQAETPHEDMREPVSETEPEPINGDVPGADDYVEPPTVDAPSVIPIPSDADLNLDS